LPQGVKARFAYPVYEPVLHVADAVAGATQLSVTDKNWVNQFGGQLIQSTVP
jgi:hypothetical protein